MSCWNMYIAGPTVHDGRSRAFLIIIIIIVVGWWSNIWFNHRLLWLLFVYYFKVRYCTTVVSCYLLLYGSRVEGRGVIDCCFFGLVWNMRTVDSRSGHVILIFCFNQSRKTLIHEFVRSNQHPTSNHNKNNTLDHNKFHRQHLCVCVCNIVVATIRSSTKRKQERERNIYIK